MSDLSSKATCVCLAGAIVAAVLATFGSTLAAQTNPEASDGKIVRAEYIPPVREPFTGPSVRWQQKKSATKRVSPDITTTRKQGTTRKTTTTTTTKTPAQAASPPPPTPPVQNLTPAYLSGESKVIVQGNQNPLIRLGMAQNGVTMIELPASDRFFAVHAGNSDLVTVERSPTMTSDHYLVLRAGSGFITPPPQRSFRTKDGRWHTTSRQDLPVTSIIVQMRSGMALTFMIYPVQYLAQQAHRCVVTYNRAEVVAARTAAGLAVNLLEEAGTTAPPVTTTKATTQVATNTEKQPTANNTTPPNDSPIPLSSTTTTASNAKFHPVSLAALPEAPPMKKTASTRDEFEQKGPAKATSGDEAVIIEVSTRQAGKSGSFGGVRVDAAEAAKAAIIQATKEQKRFKHWTPQLHGLSVSLLPAKDLGERMQMIVMAVKNTKPGAVRLVPGHPEIFVETLAQNGKPVEIERLPKLASESTTTGRVIPSGAMVFFAVVYEPQILGAQQHLRIAVAQTNAADEPAAADLTATSTR